MSTASAKEAERRVRRLLQTSKGCRAVSRYLRASRSGPRVERRLAQLLDAMAPRGAIMSQVLASPAALARMAPDVYAWLSSEVFTRDKATLWPAAEPAHPPSALESLVEQIPSILDMITAPTHDQLDQDDLILRTWLGGLRSEQTFAIASSALSQILLDYLDEALLHTEEPVSGGAPPGLGEESHTTPAAVAPRLERADLEGMKSVVIGVVCIALDHILIRSRTESLSDSSCAALVAYILRVLNVTDSHPGVPQDVRAAIFSSSHEVCKMLPQDREEVREVMRMFQGARGRA